MRALFAFLFVLLVPTWAHARDELRLWHAWRGAEEEALVEALRTWDGPPVELLAIPYDAFSSKLGSAIPFGEGPDVYVESHERLGEYRRRELVAAIGDAWPHGAFVPVAAQAVTIAGDPLALPLSLKSHALYVNDALVDRVPATLEEIVALQSNLPDGVVAIAYEAQSPYAHAPILHAFGGTLMHDDGRFGFVGREAVRSLELVLHMLEVGAVPREADGALVTNLFRGGKAAFAMSGPWLASDLADAELRYHVVPLPRLAATGQPLKPLLTVEAVMLSPTGAQKPEARRLAAFLAGEHAAQLRMQRARMVSARSDLVVDDPLVRAFAEQAHVAVPMSTSTAMRAAWEPAKQAMRKVLRGEVDPATALAEAERRFAQVMRPPPPPASPTPAIVLLSFAALAGALALVQRARTSAFRERLRRSVHAWRWVVHAVVAVGVLVVLPLTVGAAASFFGGPAGETHYVGLANFVDILRARGGPLFASGSFWLVLCVTVLWTIVNVALHLGLGLGFGLLLARPTLRMRAAYRVLLIIPWAVPNYVTALAWKGMFHRQFGAVTGATLWLNDVFGLSLEPIAWFSRFATAFTANVATNAWLGFPFMMVVTVAALGGVSRDVLEAAEVDGASAWQRFWHVTLPMIKPSLVPAVTLGAIWTFNMFNVVFLVSGGDPDGTTDILVSEAYRWAFTRDAQYGYAAAYAVLIFGLLALGTRLLSRVDARARRHQ
ncbi:MAG TPA: extracellular solute-binding protein [Nannocystaceae bacterium]|nr:extracellular solute-binding protein [Nannocystaceae bacterium]